MTNILALDLGTNMGWCIKTPYTFKSGHMKFKSPFRHESFGDFYSFLFDLTYGRDWHVVVEKPNQFGQGYHAKRVLFGMLGIIEFMFPEENITQVSATTIKKFITGSGKADKDQMLMAVNSVYEFTLDNHNEADAVALMWYYLKETYGIGN